MSQHRVQRRWRDARVALLSGGLSSERAVSEVTSDAIEAALVARDYDVVRIDARRDLPSRLLATRAEVVFLGLHGNYGEDGRVQGLLDWMGLPYTSEDARTSLFAFDKSISKHRFEAAGVPTPAYALVEISRDATAPSLPFDYPVVVKPVDEGSSVGVHFVETPGRLDDAIRAAGERSDRLLIEPKLEGPELSVAVLGDTVLGSVEIEPARDFYDYDAKYSSAGTRYHLPPRVTDGVIRSAEAAALAAHRALGCRALTRVDLFASPVGPQIIEVNTLPGMTPTSLVPKIAGRAGIEFEDLIEMILDRASCGRSIEARRSVRGGVT